MNKPHILLVIDHLNGGGAASQMTILARTLKANGYNITIFTYHAGSGHLYDALKNEKIPVLCNDKHKNKVGIIFALRKLIRANDYACIISYLITPNLYSTLAKVLSLKSIPVLISERSAINTKGPRRIKHFRSLYLRLASFVLFNSHDNRIDAVKTYPFIKHKAQTIYNAIELSKFEKRKPFAAGFETNTLNVLAIATPRPAKNLMCIAAALNDLVNEDGMDIVVNWVGPTDLDAEASQHVQEVTAYLVKHEIVERWVWLGRRNDIKTLISKYDLLVHASFSEGLPNVICEALSCGLPVLASNVCDHPLLIGEKRERGLLFDPNDYNSLIKCIKAFSKLSTSELNTMQNNAIKYAEEDFSQISFLNNYVHIIKKTTGTLRN